MTKQKDIISNQLPYIHKVEREIGVSNNVIKEKILTVQGRNLSECKKVFDKEWKNNLKEQKSKKS